MMYTSFSIKPSERTCQQCNKELFGREDKRFCSDSCRNAFNRAKSKGQVIADKEFVTPIFKAIRKNHEILTRLTSSSHWQPPCTISRHLLIEHGFHFKFFTSIRKQKDGGIYYFCFEYGWKELDDHKLMLVLNYEQIDL